ncbi:MAG: hypothetical protein AAF205_01545 [Pseudomonadota bacterium]
MRRYALTLFAGLALLMVAAAGANWLIDPYGYWHAPRLTGLNVFKPKAGRHLAAVKGRQAARILPKTIVAGNSRVHVGIDPASAVWPAAYRPVYNYGLPGVGLASLTTGLDDVIETTGATRLYLGVDFIDFRLPKTAWTAPVAYRPPDALALTRDTLISLDALTDSLATVAEQHSAYPFTITDLGANGTGSYDELVATEGHFALFDQRERANIAALSRAERRFDWQTDNPASVALEAFLADMAARGVEVVIFTYPYHAQLLGAFAAVGAWPEFIAWKRDLVRIADAADVPLWDFARFGPVTAERVPAVGDTRTRLDHYWEAGHFKAALGNRLIADMLAGESEIGVRLAPSTVDRALTSNREACRALFRGPDGARLIERAGWRPVAGSGQTLPC